MRKNFPRVIVSEYDVSGGGHVFYWRSPEAKKAGYNHHVTYVSESGEELMISLSPQGAEDLALALLGWKRDT